MSDTINHDKPERAGGSLAARYETLVHCLGILRQLDELDPETRDPDAIGAFLVRALTRADAAEHCSIMRFDPGHGCLRLRAVGSRYAEQGYSLSADTWHGKTFMLGEGIAGHVAATRNAVQTGDAPQHPNFFTIPESPVTVRSLLCFPLIWRDRVLGVLNMSHGTPSYFGADAGHCGGLIANRLSALLARAEGGDPGGESRDDATGGTADAEPPDPVALRPDRVLALGNATARIEQCFAGEATGIRALLDSALQEESWDRARLPITRARDVCAAMAGSLESLHAFTATTTAPRVETAIDIAELLHSVRDFIQGRTDVAVSCDTGAKVALPALEGDRTRIHQAMLCLALNALEVAQEAPEGGGDREQRIHLVADVFQQPRREHGPRLARAGGNYVRLAVSDNLGGLPAGQSSRVITPFFSTRPGHLGLGLSAAYHTARIHGGWLDVKNSPGHGATISLYLPVNKAAAPTTGAPKETDGGRPIVLLVDDESVIRSVGAALLRKLGYDTMLAGNGPEAIECCQNRRGQIVLAIVDINMPGMNGRYVMRHLREIAPDLPVILSSGDLENEATPAAPEDRPDGYLAKPYLIATLAEVIQNALDRHVPE